MAYCDHYHFRTHHSLGGVAGSFEVPLQSAQNEQPWCYTEDGPGIWNGGDALP